MTERVRHSEQRLGEVYLVNSNLICFGTIGWSTKRMGSVDYKANVHHVLGRLRPVFVQYSEMLSKGLVATKGPLSLVKDTHKARKILPVWNKVLENVKASRAQHNASCFKQWSQTHTPK